MQTCDKDTTTGGILAGWVRRQARVNPAIILKALWDSKHPFSFSILNLIRWFARQLFGILKPRQFWDGITTDFTSKYNRFPTEDIQLRGEPGDKVRFGWWWFWG